MACVYILLLCLFTLENLWDCFKQDFKRTMYYLLNPAICLTIPVLCAYLGSPSYEKNFFLFHLMYSLVYDVSSYRLMLSHMTKSNFAILGLEHLIAIAPLLTMLIIPEQEVLVTKICVGLIFILFYGHFYMLAREYLVNNPERRFFTIKDTV